MRVFALVLVASLLLIQPARAEPREDPPKVALTVNAWDAQPAILWLSTERWHAAEPKPVKKPTTKRHASPAVYGDGACGGDLPSCGVLECESHGNLTAQNPRSTASGKWQVLDTTWRTEDTDGDGVNDSHDGYSRASDAPESVQDERARQIYAGGAGRGQWVC